MQPAIEDGQYTVRETPAWKVRERWVEIRLIVHQQILERDLAFAHLSDHLDSTLEPIPWVPKKTTWWEAAKDKIAVYFCIFLHAKPTYRRGDQSYVCACGRKYAVPWADMSKIGMNVYVPTKPFVAPKTPIRQALCKNGWMGEV
jgi:hypothetical protein